MTRVLDDVEESIFGLLLPQWLGRLPVTTFLDMVFLFSDEVGGRVSTPLEQVDKSE